MGKVLQRTVAELFVLLQVTHRGDLVQRCESKAHHLHEGTVVGAPACEVVCARAQVDVEGVDSRVTVCKVGGTAFSRGLGAMVRAVPMPEP